MCSQTVDRQTSREALRALLRAILFHRLFGVVTPVTLDVLDVTLPAVRDVATERVVDGKVDTFLRAMMAVQQATRLGTIELMFCEKRIKRGGWFYTGEVSERGVVLPRRLTTAPGFRAGLVWWGCV
jgi:autophagy-related protein 101